MSLKSDYYNLLKEAGYEFQQHFRDYTVVQLEALAAAEGLTLAVPTQAPSPVAPPAPKAAPDEVAGLRTYSGDETPIRVDDEGLVWFRDEVRKPGGASPRRRRRLTYIDPGVQEVTATGSDRYIERFEIAGTASNQAEVTITMPTYQVGVYLDPRFPFKIHVYNDTRGFDLFDVQEFYGGADLVPSTIKRVYISNDLCYDMRSVIQAIQSEARAQQLQGDF